MQGADRLSTPTLLLMLFRLRHGVRVNPEDRVERPVLLYDVEMKTGQKAARDTF
ncbi:MAG: hypothetical protein E6543_00225 [Enterobacter hormaechei]|nr:hypothetical protein [Enterobacter hormaechei]